MNRIQLILIGFVFAMGCTLTIPGWADDKFSSEQIRFFESRIRPILAQHCFECHGPEKSESGLRLDSRRGTLTGGSSGIAGAIPGSPDESVIIRSVRHVGDFAMPPDHQISEPEIADLAKWVEMHLPWPMDSATNFESIQDRLENHRQTHWSFQPPSRASLPPDNNQSAVDRLICAKLQGQGLERSPRADRRTLIRRASFDLLGLPPTFAEVASFEADESPDAYAQLIDRLLDSPHYGERWARHWLDVARYADTRGYALNEEDNSYPFAYTYRDYVIDAFNRDLPYDQFINQQIAADHLDVAADKKSLAALGFLTVGRKFLNRTDTLDDQVDVITRGLMGLTVSCARCHDHKYDAIPAEDYYSLFGVMANNFEPSELPLIGPSTNREAFADYFQTLDTLKQDVASFRKTKHNELLIHVRNHFVDYLSHVIAPDQASTIEALPYVRLKGSALRASVLAKWRRYLARHHDDPHIIKPTMQLLAIADDQFETDANRLIGHWKTHPNETKINSKFLKKIEANPPKQKLDLAKVLAELFTESYQHWDSTGKLEPAIQQFKGDEAEIAKILFDARSPARFPIDQLDNYLAIPARKELGKLREKIRVHNRTAPDGLTRAMVVRDKQRLVTQRVMKRGNPNRLGDPAPRRFLALLSPESNGVGERPIFQDQSGRLNLAKCISSRDNPLTARVLVNRVWMHHFSTPLVDTPSDFGIRCKAPIQQDVLDHLAVEFMENGWSIKQLHRAIMLSETYCQSSRTTQQAQAIDPENRFYWKMNRRRLEFEPLRDSILAVSGQLERQLHGKPIDLFQRPLSNRRTIYGTIDRQDLPGLYRVFDLASPDQSAAQRIRTTVPQQSLFMLNSAFVAQHSRHVVDAIPDSKKQSIPDQLSYLYQVLFQRNPDDQELELGTRYIRDAMPKTEEKNLTPWQRYAQLLLCTNEFEFID